MAIRLVWNLVTASVMIAINLTVPITLLKFIVTLLMSNNLVLLVKKVSAPFQFDVGVCTIATTCLIDYFVFTTMENCGLIYSHWYLNL
jgi:hypothetical protein